MKTAASRRVPSADAPSTREIIYSESMVRALLDDRKTQTRRVVRHQPHKKVPFTIEGDLAWPYDGNGVNYCISNNPKGPDGWTKRCPYGQPGDRLWVRENFYLDDRNSKDRVPREVIFAATPEWALDCFGKLTRVTAINGALVSRWDAERSVKTNKHWRKKPAIHMPRWVSRITLEITGVRLERVQDISEADAIAEGAEPNWVDTADLAQWDPTEHGYLDPADIHYPDGCDCSHGCPTARAWFQAIWNRINASRDFGWESNPWVWVIDFRRITP